MSLKKKTSEGKVCCGTFILIGKGADYSQFICTHGFDYLILDMEHTCLDISDIREMILPAQKAGVATIVRIPELRYDYVARALDAGASGIMLPRVESEQEAQELVRYAKYKPDGCRGFTTFSAQTDYSKLADPEKYTQTRNQELFLVVQIESVKAVENARKILSVPGISCCFIGTNDLAFDMGLAGQTEHPDVESKIAECHLISKEYGLAFSLPVRKPADIKTRLAQGISILTLSSDASLFTSGAKLFLDELK